LAEFWISLSFSLSHGATFIESVAFFLPGWANYETEFPPSSRAKRSSRLHRWRRLGVSWGRVWCLTAWASLERACLDTPATSKQGLRG